MTFISRWVERRREMDESERRVFPATLDVVQCNRRPQAPAAQQGGRGCCLGEDEPAECVSVSDPTE